LKKKNTPFLFVYDRFADDWIILGNFSIKLALKIKNHIKKWLKTNLGAELSEEKTLISLIKKVAAHFLGFEIRSVSSVAGKLSKTKKARFKIEAEPDHQRQIDKLMLRGYCSNTGEPKAMRWLTSLSTPALIERFNTILSGVGNFYLEFISVASLKKWLYIIRACFLKTLALKMGITVKAVYQRYGIKTPTGKTISFSIEKFFPSEGKVRKKTWVLYTDQDLQRRAKLINIFEQTKENFNLVEFKKKNSLF
jgi:hypothetical protein